MSKLIRSDSEVVALYLRTLYIREIWGQAQRDGEEASDRRGERRKRVIS